MLIIPKIWCQLLQTHISLSTDELHVLTTLWNLVPLLSARSQLRERPLYEQRRLFCYLQSQRCQRPLYQLQARIRFGDK